MSIDCTGRAKIVGHVILVHVDRSMVRAALRSSIIEKHWEERGWCNVDFGSVGNLGLHLHIS